MVAVSRVGSGSAQSGSSSPPISYDIGAGRSPRSLAQPAGDVGAGLGLAAVLHALLDVAAASRGRAGLVEPLVLAAAGEVLGAGVDAGLEVEDDRVVRVADQDGVALDRAELDQPLPRRRAG